MAGQYHQYKLYYSTDGKKWNLLVDKATIKQIYLMNMRSLQHLFRPRYIRLENIHMPTGKFAISGLRIFGNGNGARPDMVKQFIVLERKR